jgi:hypothetical protein
MDECGLPSVAKPNVLGECWEARVCVNYTVVNELAVCGVITWEPVLLWCVVVTNAKQWEADHG